MNLERVAAVVRPRSTWEAIDLGATLVQAWWRRVLPVWLTVVLPLWLLVFTLTRSAPGWAFFLLWWTRPLFDALPLFVVSRALFGERSRLGQVLRATPRQWLRVAPAYLFLERLDPARSFHLPVRLLEGLKAAARWRRQGVLNGQGHVQAALLTAVYRLIELFLLVGLWALLTVLVPTSIAPDWGRLFELYTSGELASWPYHLLWGLLWFVAFTVSELLYVASGFTLYLNRRSTLEGWDVEIAFKRLSLRLAERKRQETRQVARQGRGRTAAVLPWVLVALGAAAGVTAQESPTPTSPTRTNTAPLDPAQATIEKVLAHPDFGSTEKVRLWKWRFESEPDPETDEPAGAGFTLAWVGPIFEVGLWVLVGLAVALLLGYWLKNRGSGDGGDLEDTVLPEFLSRSGRDQQPRPLPADVPGEALRLAEDGRLVEALSLLYRAALVRLARSQGTELEASWTEGECLRRLARQAAAGTGEVLSALTRAWQDAAYAHRPPSRDQIAALCDAFKRFIAPA